MKSLKHITTGLLFFIAISMTAQQSINYKAIIKDGSGNVVANDLIVVQFQILQGTGLTNVYQETHTPTTDGNGMVILNIGEGTVNSGDYSTIIWGDDDYFLNVKIDTGTGLTDMGTTEFKAVPYALHSEKANGAINAFEIEIPTSTGKSLMEAVAGNTPSTYKWVQTFIDGDSKELKIIADPENQRLTLEQLKERETQVPPDDPRHKELTRLLDGGADEETAYEIAFGNNSTVTGTRTGMNEESVETPATGLFTNSVVDPNGTNNDQPMKVTWEPDQKTKTTENEEVVVHVVTDPYVEFFDDGSNQIFQLYDPTAKVIRFESTAGIVTVQIQGDLSVNGILSKLAGTFKIDHPLDPYNKYLSHSFVESPDMMNVYNGNITTDEDGVAIIALPSYFEALNGDFRYQLTCVGTFAQAIVSEKVRNNEFSIMTNKPNVEVSWQVTGIRKDAFAQDNRVRVETDKEPENVGTLLYDPNKEN